MKLQQILLLLVALLLGIFIGRKTVSVTGSEEASSGIRTNNTAASTVIGSHDSADAGATRSSRPRGREEKKAATDSGKKIAIPLSLIAQDLKAHQFHYRNFEQMDEAMDTALTMLGADERERIAVKLVMQEAKMKVFEAEKTRSKVLKSDETGIDIDVSGIKDALPDIVAQTKTGLRDSLAPDIGEALVDSMDWQHFYSHTDNYDTPVSFAIIRNRNGSLSARTKHGGGSMSRGLRPEDFPTDGSAAPIGSLFGERWQHFVEGAKMAPVDTDE